MIAASKCEHDFLVTGNVLTWGRTKSHDSITFQLRYGGVMFPFAFQVEARLLAESAQKQGFLHLASTSR